ncbi:MAG: heme o synthase [Flexibacteraceae bacterium]
MSQNQVITLTYSDKLKAFGELTKFRLSSLVVFSAAMTFLLAAKDHTDFLKLFSLVIGGFLVTAAANIINQVKEIEIDKLMKRTANRPLPTGRLSKEEAMLFGMACAVAGMLLLVVYVNVLTAAITFLSMLLYGFVYTPLKSRTPLSVLVGAIPGALPPMIGWVAETGTLGIEAWVLFGIQFIWQFPHFWAIAWILDDDYQRVGFKMLPNGGGKDMNTAFQIMIYTLFLLPLGMLPTQLGITGPTSAIVATICGCMFLMTTFHLMKECTAKAARSILLGSVIYLPIVQIVYVFDKI